MNLRSLTKAKIKEMGYESATQYSKSKQTLTFIELAHAVDPELPPILLLSILREESVLYGTWEYFVRTSFVRCVIEQFPDGWMTGLKVEFHRAGVYGFWCSSVGGVAESAKITIRNRIKDETFIPNGWKPTGVDDDVIKKLFTGIVFETPTMTELGLDT